MILITPRYRLMLGAAALLSAAAGVMAYRSHIYHLGYAAAESERAARDAVAVLNRTTENAVLSIKQDAINAIITKVKHEELAPVRERIAAERVRIGSAICGPATQTETEGAGGGDGGDSPGRLVRPDIERDIRTLKLAVEEHLATGRACQAFLAENELVQ